MFSFFLVLYMQKIRRMLLAVPIFFGIGRCSLHASAVHNHLKPLYYGYPVVSISEAHP